MVCWVDDPRVLTDLGSVGVYELGGGVAGRGVGFK